MGRTICGVGPRPRRSRPDEREGRPAVRGARQLAYFRKAGRPGQARRIVEGLLAPDVVEHAMEYPVTTELPSDGAAYQSLLARFYDDWAERLMTHRGSGTTWSSSARATRSSMAPSCICTFACRDACEVEVIPGIPGMAGCWTATGIPITWGDDVMTVLPGTLGEDELVRHMTAADALVVMKIGRNLPKRPRARCGAPAGWSAHGSSMRGAMPGERVVRLAEVGDDDCPYFATVIVHGEERRPEPQK